MLYSTILSVALLAVAAAPAIAYPADRFADLEARYAPLYERDFDADAAAGQLMRRAKKNTARPPKSDGTNLSGNRQGRVFDNSVNIQQLPQNPPQWFHDSDSEHEAGGSKFKKVVKKVMKKLKGSKSRRALESDDGELLARAFDELIARMDLEELD